MMLNYPNIDPVAFQIGAFKVYWYGLMYLVGFLSAWALAHYRIRHYLCRITAHQVSDLIFYLAIGAVVGGRLGHVIFYDLAYFVAHPLAIFKVWEGGMSFHGGLIGALFSLFFFSKKVHRSFFEVADFVAPLTPLGLAAGRIGNFINGELFGRPTQVPWAMVFPRADDQPRHPSQLYEFALEGVLLFIIIWLFARKPRPKMAVSGLFLVSYGVVRFLVEFFRAPDIDFILFSWVTMGQLLSIPMILAGILLLFNAYCRPIKPQF